MRPFPRPVLLAAAVALVPGAGRAQGSVPPREQQIAGAVTPLPESMRAGAAVLGYDAGFKLQRIRPGTNGMTCLADDPRDDAFHTSCYHDAMEPFMARGRQLRAEGVKDDQVDTVRFAEVKSGRLKMPTQPASLYQIFGKKDAFDATTGKLADGARSLFVVYIPYATEQSTGLLAKPRRDGPWLMYPGTPKAHIMFTTSMQ